MDVKFCLEGVVRCRFPLLELDKTAFEDEEVLHGCGGWGVARGACPRCFRPQMKPQKIAFRK